MEQSVQQSVPTSSPSIPSPPPKPFWKTPQFLLIIPIVLLVIGIVIFSLLQKYRPTTPTQSTTKESHPEGTIAKVGEEYIYQNDLDTEVRLNPISSNSAQLKKQLLQKLADDSIIIQGALSDKIATADASVYNSPTKDQIKRYQLVSQIKKSIEEKADTISGFKVNIWFLNVHVGPLGYDKAKQIALEKITKLHSDVVSKKITIQQAADAIKNDSSLAAIDPSYKSNAGGEFTSTKDKPITITKAFDDALWNTSVGGITEVITGQSDDQDNGGKIVDAYYTFGTVTSKTQNGRIVSFEDWLAQKRKLYAILSF